MQQIASRWRFYWRALEHGDFSGWDAPDGPFPGFWRCRYSPHDHWRPAFTADSEHGLIAALGRPSADGHGFVPRAIDPLTLWGSLWCWQHPVTEAQYHHAIEHGSWWDSLRASRTEPKPGRIVTDVRRAEPIGPVLKPRGR
jgi:hypothetical protein